MYRVARCIGRGGMGSVYEAYDPRLDRRVALKLLHAAPTELDLERFHREARAFARLDHPGIVNVHEVNVEDGRWFMVLDLLEQGSLADRLKREGPCAPREAAHLVRMLAEALQHAHENGVLHRDVKPGNVLLGPAGEPRLTDFGLVKELRGLDGLTVTGEILGTPAYMSPEQALGEHVDARCDVYALGATLYAALTGRPPFAGPSPLRVMNDVVQKAPLPPSQLAPVDAQLERICLRCLAKDPRRRHQRAADLSEALGRYLSVPTQRPAERPWRLRARLVQASAAVVMAAFVAAGGVLILAGNESEPGALDWHGVPASEVADEGPGFGASGRSQRSLRGAAGARGESRAKPEERARQELPPGRADPPDRAHRRTRVQGSGPRDAQRSTGSPGGRRSPALSSVDVTRDTTALEAAFSPGGARIESSSPTGAPPPSERSKATSGAPAHVMEAASAPAAHVDDYLELLSPQRDPDGYVWQSYLLVNQSPSGYVSLLACAPGGELVVGSAPGGITCVGGRQGRDEVSLPGIVSSATSLGGTTYVATSGPSGVGGFGDVYQRTASEWRRTFDGQAGVAMVARLGGEVYAVLGDRTPGVLATVHRYHAPSGSWQPVGSLGDVEPARVVVHGGRLWIGCSPREAGGRLMLFSGSGSGWRQVRLNGERAGPDQRAEFSALFSCRGHLFAATSSCEVGSGEAERGAVRVLVGGQLQQVAQLRGDAPSALAFADGTVYVATRGGRLHYLEVEGRAGDEDPRIGLMEDADLPAVAGIRAMLAAPDGTLLLGIEGPYGAEVLRRLPR